MVYLAMAGAMEMSRFASSEFGSISVKSENSKPGATEHPTRTVSDTGAAACQVPAGMTWQKRLLLADRVIHLGGVFVLSQMYKLRPAPWYRFQISSEATL